MPCAFIVLVALMAGQTVPTGTVDATTLVMGPPIAALQIDGDKLKGEPYRLAWSPDATELYLQMVERDRSGKVWVTHHAIGLAERRLRRLDGEPPWAATYWAWKAAQAAPGAPNFRITVDFKEELVRPTATPMGGNLARGDPGASGGGAGAGAGVGIDEAAAAAYQSQKVASYTLRLKGEVLGEWKNAPVVPGLTFGWSPASLGAIAFATPKGDLVVMDAEVRKQPVTGAKDALLPAWSDDGRRVAYLSKAGKKKFVLYLVDVSRSLP